MNRTWDYHQPLGPSDPNVPNDPNDPDDPDDPNDPDPSTTPYSTRQGSMPDSGTLWRQVPSWSFTKSRILKRASKGPTGSQGDGTMGPFKNTVLGGIFSRNVQKKNKRSNQIITSDFAEFSSYPDLGQGHKGHIHLRSIRKGLRQELP